MDGPRAALPEIIFSTKLYILWFIQQEGESGMPQHCLHSLLNLELEAPNNAYTIPSPLTLCYAGFHGWKLRLAIQFKA